MSVLIQTYCNAQGTGQVPELVLFKDNGDINSEAQKDLLNGDTNTYINQIGTEVINDNKPNNLKWYKCDSCDYAVVQNAH